MSLKNSKNHADHIQGEEALQAHHRPDAPQEWGVVTSINDLSVSNFREKIAGVEVVDAAFADRLLRAMGAVMVRHSQWRWALSLENSPSASEEDQRKARSMVNKTRAKYRKARAHAYVVMREACGSIVDHQTVIPPTV